jgi:alcohol dehydrogenase (cytochrome c)
MFKVSCSLVLAILLATCVLTYSQTAPTGANPRKASNVTFDRILHADQEPQNWLTYSRTLSGERHSPLTQITPANVPNLELAWSWQAEQTAGVLSATPLVVDGVMYTVQAPNDVIALDAATGRVLWKFPYAPDPRASASGGGRRPNRGLAILDGTLFMGTLDAHLLAIDAASGKLLWSTPVANAVDPICQGRLCYVITHAPLVVKDKVLVGVGGSDGPTRCFLAAFDSKTGKELWRFYSVPAPGEPGNETWSGDSWKTGGGGIWNTGTYDPELNLTYWGTGNPFPPRDGRGRIGDNLYTDSVIALDADTGAMKWHYQFTPHDDQDWDATQIPVLVDVQWQGNPRKAMLFANRNGLVYIFDRVTGEFLLGKPYVQVNWMSGFDDKGRPKRVAPPVVFAATIVQPYSATNWDPPAFSPRTGLLYVPAWERASMSGRPASGPGYSTVRALDPNTGEKKWEFKLNDGWLKGVLTTASDLLFVGSTGDDYSPPEAARLADRYFFALDARTGDVRWRMALTGEIRSAPMSYSVDGKQYVAVSTAQTLFTFALR